MVTKKYIPSRGDIVWIDFDPTKGHEQSGRSPAIVVSPLAYNKLSHRALFCPITSRTKGYVFEVEFKGDEVVGAILADQIRTLDWSKRRVTFSEKAPRVIVDEVEARLLVLIHEN